MTRDIVRYADGQPILVIRQSDLARYITANLKPR